MNIQGNVKYVILPAFVVMDLPRIVARGALLNLSSSQIYSFIIHFQLAIALLLSVLMVHSLILQLIEELFAIVIYTLYDIDCIKEGCKCSDIGTDCHSCLPTYFYYNATCLNVCPEDYYGNQITQICSIYIYIYTYCIYIYIYNII